MEPKAAQDAWERRSAGKDRTGTVGLRDFDMGVVETLRAFVQDDNYFVSINGVEPPPGMPGVPVTFAFPEDIFEKYRIPVIIVQRDEIAPAMQRWHPGTLQYRTPAEESLPVSVQWNAMTLNGFDRYEQLQQSCPFDISYTITVQARLRGAPAGTRNMANKVFEYVLRVYQPYSSVVRVRDSVGDLRSYEAFMEGTSNLDKIDGVTERMLGFALNLRVEAELDLLDPETYRAVSKTLTIRTK